MVTDDTEKAVFELVREVQRKEYFYIQAAQLELSTDLNEDFRIDPDEAYELLECYAKKFSIDPRTITFSAYFPEDFTEPHDPLTIGLMVESARAGRWLENKIACKSRRQRFNVLRWFQVSNPGR